MVAERHDEAVARVLKRFAAGRTHGRHAVLYSLRAEEVDQHEAHALQEGREDQAVLRQNLNVVWAVVFSRQMRGAMGTGPAWRRRFPCVTQSGYSNVSAVAQIHPCQDWRRDHDLGFLESASANFLWMQPLSS